MIAISYHRLAARELLEAHAWYRARDPEVAERFLGAVEAAIARIREDPSAQPVELTKFRWARARRFPYRLVFEQTDDGRVLIIAVVHSSRRPRYWRGRT